MSNELFPKYMIKTRYDGRFTSSYEKYRHEVWRRRRFPFWFLWEYIGDFGYAEQAEECIAKLKTLCSKPRYF